MILSPAIILPLLVVPLSASTLHFLPQSPDRPLGLYNGPPTYRGKYESRSSIIITSKPLGMSTEDYTTTTALTPTTSTVSTESPKWQRKSVTQIAESSTDPQKPRNILALPHYTVECSSGKSCSEMIKSDRTTVKPTFKSYSKETVDKFLKEYDLGRNDESIENIPAPRERPISMKPVYDYSQFKITKHEEKSDKDEDLEPVNRLANLILDRTSDSEASESVLTEERSKPHWSLLNSQHHHHPFDDHEGWVTLEAVPWSKSKISKWYPHGNRPWNSNSKPQYGHHNLHHDWELDKPSEKPDWDLHPQKPHWDKPSDWNFQKPEKPHHNHWITPDDDSWTLTSKPSLHKPWSKPTNHWEPNYHDIITDNSPGNWPPSPEKWPTERPHGDNKPWAASLVGHIPHESFPHKKPFYDSSGHPPGHPENSDGEWVLLSSTKGYSAPERYKTYKRALNLNPKPLTSTRSVRLTVLPPQNGTINTTTSHGGLLEVHKTFQTVEEDQQLLERLKKLNNSRLSYRPQTQTLTTLTQARPIRIQNAIVTQRPTVTQLRPIRLVGPINTNNNLRITRTADGSSAVLAAVGAGLVPASMAVMVPMFLGRRRKRRNAPMLISPDAVALSWKKETKSQKKSVEHKTRNRKSKYYSQSFKDNHYPRKGKFSYKNINKKKYF